VLTDGDGTKTHHNRTMDKQFQDVLARVEPISDSIFGPRYRCELTLKDGTCIPCAVLQSKSKRIELAKRRIAEEMTGKGKIGGPDPFGQLLAVLVASGNRISSFAVASAIPSRFAPSLTLMRRIEGETTMGWTGWVFEMKDGKLFSYGSGFGMEFLNLPEGYEFDDVLKVHNHSFISNEGRLSSLERGSRLPADFGQSNMFRERVFFEVYIDGI